MAHIDALLQAPTALQFCAELKEREAAVQQHGDAAGDLQFPADGIMESRASSFNGRTDDDRTQAGAADIAAGGPRLVPDLPAGSVAVCRDQARAEKTDSAAIDNGWLAVSRAKW